jgi:hypothetical protein
LDKNVERFQYEIGVSFQYDLNNGFRNGMDTIHVLEGRPGVAGKTPGQDFGHRGRCHGSAVVKGHARSEAHA